MSYEDIIEDAKQVQDEEFKKYEDVHAVLNKKKGNKN